MPRYDRAALTRSVVHLGVGSFHRSHQAAYFDALARRGVTSWGVTGVGLRRPQMRDALGPQDGLYTLVTRGNEGDEARVIGAITQYLYAPEDRRAVLDALRDARTRLVTLTITAGAYDLPTAGRSLADSALALLVDALDRRRSAGGGPFTVLSCDNLTASGRTARAAVLGVAQARDERLATWIEKHVAFPDAMVDRITPKTTSADRAFVAKTFGVIDRWPVLAEPFSQWIVEDAFCCERPPLDEAGVQFVSDVTPYALAKTRLLNGTHCALGALGCLAGLRRTDQVMADPAFAAFAARMMAEEVAPFLPPVPGLDLAAYRRQLLERLANPRIHDSLPRLCRSGSDKVARHLLPSILEARSAGAPHGLLTVAVAGWLLYLRGIDEQGRPLELDDPMADKLRAAARAAGRDPRPLLAVEEVFGSLGRDEHFALEVERALLVLEQDGARAAASATVAMAEPLAA